MTLLTTKRLVLVPFQETDFLLIASVFRDPYVRKYLWDDEIIPDEIVRDLLKTNSDHFALEKWGLWKIVDDRKNVIGFTGLWHFFEEAQPQLLYGLLPAYSGHGFASEAALEIVTYAFRELGFTYLDASMDKPHRDSQKVAQRIGMKFLKESLEDGKPTVFYRIERSNFQIS